MDNGVRYLIHMKGTPKIERGPRGQIRSAGLWWRTGTAEWGDSRMAYGFTESERDAHILPPSGEWVETYVNVEKVGA